MRKPLKDLIQWADALNITVKDSVAQIESALDGQSKLPDSCPSKEAMAELIFRQIEKKFREVEEAMTEVKKLF